MNPDNVEVTTTKFEYQKDPVSGDRFVQVNDNLNVSEVVLSREGIFKGFVYHVPTPRTFAGALAIFNNDENALLDAVSKVLGQMAYARAMAKLRAQLPPDIEENEKVAKWLARHKSEIDSLKLTDPVLFTIEDAINFKPGERELTPAGLLRQIGKVQAEGTKLLAGGNLAGASEKFSELKSLMERFTAYTEALQKQASSGEEDAS